MHPLRAPVNPPSQQMIGKRQDQLVPLYPDYGAPHRAPAVKLVK